MNQLTDMHLVYGAAYQSDRKAVRINLYYLYKCTQWLIIHGEYEKINIIVETCVTLFTELMCVVKILSLARRPCFLCIEV